MSAMRIYVPATWPMLRTLVKNGTVDPIGGTAFALTPGLREAYTSGDDEELEYVALSDIDVLAGSVVDALDELLLTAVS